MSAVAGALRLGGLAALALVLAAGVGGRAAADPTPIEVSARVIERFQVGSAATRFGALEFVGGLELSSTSNALGAMSGLRLSPDRSRFLGVMDTGHWFAGRIQRDPEGRPVGVEDFSVAPILDEKGEDTGRKWLVDSESLAIRGEEVLVGFERDHRIERYPARDPAGSRPIGRLDLPIPVRELRSNRGLETIAVSPQAAGLGGAAIAVSERSLDRAGNIFAAILDGPERGVFFVRRDPPYDVTDGAFLPDGDLVLLERRFSIADGVGMRIRRFKGSEIRPGRTIAGTVLIEADFGYQIDNMEGLDASVDDAGQIFLTLVSDDNHSILQRNLILEFRLADQNDVPN